MTYSIGFVAELLEVSPQLLRNLEKQNLIPTPHRRASNRREYSKQDVQAIREFLSQKNITK